MSMAEELQKSPEKVFDRLEAACELPSFLHRRRLAHYLISVASDLLHTEPHVHVGVERAVNPPLICLSITRQLYGPGHPANDEPVKSNLFEPP